MLKSSFKTLLLLLLLVFTLVACGSNTETNEVTPTTESSAESNDVTSSDETKEDDATTTPEGELIVSLSTLPNSIYSANAAERNADNVASQIFDGLTWIDDEGNIVPALAESWEIDETGTVYTFTLRQGVVFHNGETFDAQDVITSWEAGKTETNNYAYDYERAATIEKIDDYTIVVTTPEPDPLFLRIIEQWAIIPTDYYNEVGLAGIETKPVGTGAFQFVEWKQGDRIVLEANPNYWEEGLPRLARVIFRPIPESSTRVAAIQTGEIHIANRLSPEEAQSITNAPNLQMVNYPVDRVFYIAFNNLTTGVDTPIEDTKVRQALNYAVDRQAIVDALFNGYASLSTGFITPENLGYNDSLAPYPYDPERAKTLLAEAGYADGFTIGFACPTGAYTNFEQVCQAIAGYLEDVGVTLEGDGLQLLESGQYWERESEKQLPPLFGDSWSTTDGEALNRLEGALGGFDASYSAWAEPTIDDYIDQISVTVDPDARAALYSDLHQYMYDNPPFIYLYEPNTFEAVNERVQNYKPRAAENYFLKDVYLAAE